jgi:hypothetical protein
MAMVFPTSPTVGQVFTSAGRSWIWNGSAWDAPSATNVLTVPVGLEFISSTPFTSSTLVRLNSIFSSKYDNYVIVAQVSSASGTASIRARFLTGVDAPTSSSNYNGAGFSAWSAGGLSNYTSINEATFFGGITNGTLGGAWTLNVISPFLSTRTAIFQDSVAFNNHERFNRASTFNETTSVTGIQFESGATLTGVVKVYGMRN